MSPSGFPRRSLLSRPLVAVAVAVAVLGIAAPAAPAGAATVKARAVRARAVRLATVGSVRSWPVIDDARSTFGLRPYRLRSLGRHVEVWVANDLSFPAGDCRNGARTQVSDGQAVALATAFDQHVWTVESDVFGRPMARTGATAALDDVVGLPASTWRGLGDRVVVLVDNVRDDNYYDTDNASNLTSIAGFFSGAITRMVDRNVVTLDGFDWLHRSGANPPDAPDPADLCRSAPARPNLYESTLAHEYQHLLEADHDPAEVPWVNEGLSDAASTLTGLQDPSTPIDRAGFSSHIQCFLGNLSTRTAANPNPRGGGPENSLVEWLDQGMGEVLCDYGAAESFMEYGAGRFGLPFLSALHRNTATGLSGVQAALGEVGVSESAVDVVHDWAAMVGLDGVLDDGAVLTGGDRARFSTPTLHMVVNWSTPDAYATPGAPPLGSDYVRLRRADGSWLGAGDVSSVSVTSSGPVTVQLVAYDDAHREARVVRVPAGGLSGDALRAALGSTATTVAAIVTGDTTGPGYVPYQLTVDGVLQPGG